MEEVCQTMQVDCQDVDEPIYVLSEIVEELGELESKFYNNYTHYNGFTYIGEPYVFINPHDTWEKQNDTKYHEVVHYIQAMIGTDLSRCPREKQARDIAFQLSEYEFDDTWIERYGCKGEVE